MNNSTSYEENSAELDNIHGDDLLQNPIPSSPLFNKPDHNLTKSRKLVTVDGNNSMDISPKPKFSLFGKIKAILNNSIQDPLLNEDEKDELKEEETNGTKSDSESGKSTEEEGPKISRPVMQVITLLNALFGAAILNIPNFFTLSGIIPSTINLVIMMILSYITTHMTLVLQKRTNSSSLNEMATKLMGSIGSNSLLVFSLFYSITGQIVFAMVGGIMLETWLRLANIYIDTVWRRVAMIGIYMFVFPIPLTIPRKKCYLSYFPPVTILTVLFYFFAIVLKSVKFFRGTNGKICSSAKMMILDSNLFSSLSISSLTFALPIVLLPTIKNYNKNVKSRSMISGLSIVLCFLILYIPGLLGYLQFGQGTQGNILMNYPDDDELILVTRIGIFTIVSFAYVGFGNLSTNYLAQLIFKEEEGREFLVIRWKRAVVLLLVNGIPLLITMFFTNAEPALWIGGAMGGCVVGLVFPAMMWVLESGLTWYGCFGNVLCVLLAVFGFEVAGMSTYLAVVDIAKDLFKRNRSN